MALQIWDGCGDDTKLEKAVNESKDWTAPRHSLGRPEKWADKPHEGHHRQCKGLYLVQSDSMWLYRLETGWWAALQAKTWGFWWKSWTWVTSMSLQWRSKYSKLKRKKLCLWSWPCFQQGVQPKSLQKPLPNEIILWLANKACLQLPLKDRKEWFWGKFFSRIVLLFAPAVQLSLRFAKIHSLWP